MIQPEELLEQHGLSKTNIRIKVLDIMLKNQSAISESELKKQIGKNCDRTTIYRTLKTFEKKSILFRLTADDGVVRYFVDLKKCHNTHDHLHFHCVECNQLVCLQDAPITPYQLPEGYTALKNSFIIAGRCPYCREQK